MLVGRTAAHEPRHGGTRAILPRAERPEALCDGDHSGPSIKDKKARVNMFFIYPLFNRIFAGIDVLTLYGTAPYLSLTMANVWPGARRKKKGRPAINAI